MAKEKQIAWHDADFVQYIVIDDGGRAEAGYKAKHVRDCVTRSIAIATGLPYKEVYMEIRRRARVSERTGKRKKKISDPREGVWRTTYEKYLKDLGWKWVGLAKIGKPSVVHLRADELPGGTIICKIRRHLVTVIDGVIHDTYDCSYTGSKTVYGYYVKDEDVH